MAVRYSGDVNIRMRRVGPNLYHATLSTGGRNLGSFTFIQAKLYDSENEKYDDLALRALQRCSRARAYADKKGRTFEILRTARSPCPY